MENSFSIRLRPRDRIGCPPRKRVKPPTLYPISACFKPWTFNPKPLLVSPPCIGPLKTLLQTYRTSKPWWSYAAAVSGAPPSVWALLRMKCVASAYEFNGWGLHPYVPGPISNPSMSFNRLIQNTRSNPTHTRNFWKQYLNVFLFLKRFLFFFAVSLRFRLVHEQFLANSTPPPPTNCFYIYPNALVLSVQSWSRGGANIITVFSGGIGVEG